MNFTLKTNWRAMRKTFIICCAFPFALTFVFTIACIYSARSDISADPYRFPLFSLIMSFFIILFLYFTFISKRITFDGKKITYYCYFLPVKSFSVCEINSFEYSPKVKYLFINRRHAIACRLFPEKDVDELSAILAQKYNIKTGRISSDTMM